MQKNSIKHIKNIVYSLAKGRIRLVLNLKANDSKTGLINVNK